MAGGREEGAKQFFEGEVPLRSVCVLCVWFYAMLGAFFTFLVFLEQRTPPGSSVHTYKYQPHVNRTETGNREQGIVNSSQQPIAHGFVN
jgi:hypothetical protein